MSSNLGRSLEFYTHYYLPDNILAKADRATMMSSLESRSIFLDNDLIDFCQQLPQSFKYRRGQKKYILKKALSGLLPDEIIGRKKKGFGMPIGKWLMSYPHNPPLSPISGMNMRSVERSWEQHRAGKVNNRLFLWAYMALQSAHYE